MSWRPWILLTGALVAFVLNLFLVVKEQLPDGEVKQEVTRVEERLRHLQYLKEQRRSNLKEMGLDDDFAHAVASYIDSHYVRHQQRFQDLLAEKAGDVGVAFCPSAGLPQPYAALEFLVHEENQRRDVFSPDRLLSLEAQPWFGTSQATAVYETLEVTESRKSDATLMGVSALLVSREKDVLAGRSPWSMGALGSWGFRKLKKESPSVEILVIQYFSLMHYLTELANTREGICS